MTDSNTPSSARPPMPAAATITIPCTSAAFTELSAEVLRSGRSLRFRAHGKSMSPLVRDGDFLLVKPADTAALRVGSVVLCSKAPGHVVMHRIVQRDNRTGDYRWLVQGDQAPYPDGWMSPDQIYGALVRVERDGHQVNMNTPALFLLNRVAAWRLRWRFDRWWLTRSAGLAIKSLPCFSRYFS